MRTTILNLVHICKVFRFGTSIQPRLKPGTIEYKENCGSKHKNCVVFAQWGVQSVRHISSLIHFAYKIRPLKILDFRKIKSRVLCCHSSFDNQKLSGKSYASLLNFQFATSKISGMRQAHLDYRTILKNLIVQLGFRKKWGKKEMQNEYPHALPG